MKLPSLVLKNLKFYWRTNLAVIAGVAIATSVLSGALLVGQSVRGSLRALAFQRIGSVEHAVSSSGFFGRNLSESLSPGMNVCPLISLKGTVIHERTRVRIHDVNVYGIDEHFWKFNHLPARSFSSSRSAFIGAPLARQLDLKNNDGVLLRIETQPAIPREWLYGRREDVGKTLRLSADAVIDESSMGEFSLQSGQGKVFSIFVPLSRLQKDLEQPSRTNMILLSGRDSGLRVEDIYAALARHCTLEDVGLQLENLPSSNGFSLESDRILLEDPVAMAAIQAAAAVRMQASPVYSYLANSIRARGREIPYSVITAADLGAGALTSAVPVNPPQVSGTSDDSIWLTQWAVRDLGVKPGSVVEVDYYLWQESGQLVTRTAAFRFAGSIPESAGIDAGFSPRIPGITEARSISGWDPPFPLDLGRIRHEDEEFWDQYKATPKAFISLARGQKLWQNRFGRVTAVRIAPPQETNPAAARRQFERALLERMNIRQLGITVTPIRQQRLLAAAGSTDFGEYFVYFSSFLIAAAILLSVLYFKLMIEQRIREIGTLRAAGFSVKMIRRFLLLEGFFLSLAGSILGVIGAIGYGWLLVLGLRTWWIGAVGTTRIRLYFDWAYVLLGAAAAIVFSLAAITWTLRGLRYHSPRMLLNGVLEAPTTKASAKARRTVIAAFASPAAALSLLLSSATGMLPELPGFFGSGLLLLLSILCWTALYLRRHNPGLLHGHGWKAVLRFGLRNASYRPARSLICASLIASAAFIIISMEAFRQDSTAISLEAHSGTGGYPLIARSALPVIHDLNTDAGREAVGLSTLENSAGVRFVSFRERRGDDASCLNLYAPQEPTVLGTPGSFLRSGRFAFQKSLASSEAQRANPWLLLESSSADSVVPAIADANTIQYILHRSLGDELLIRADDGRPVRLRIVAALRDSIFQGELLISDANFVRFFSQNQGYRFFLLDVPRRNAIQWKKDLQEALSDWGLQIESSQERLSAYHRVENAYLTTFQSLGALGLILGTAGLATVLLRNVLERRKELAVLRAMGYRNNVLSWITLSENLLLVLWGLAAGTFSAFMAVIPALQSRGLTFPFASASLILLAVFVSAAVSSVIAVFAALRSPLLAALHSE